MRRYMIRAIWVGASWEFSPVCQKCFGTAHFQPNLSLAFSRCRLRAVDPGPPSVAIANKPWCTHVTVRASDLPTKDSHSDLLSSRV